MLPRISAFFLLFICAVQASGQSFLPPALPWKGKSESLIASKKDPWITPAEQSNFETTPKYEETVSYLKRLTRASSIIKIRTIGRTAEGRDIVVAVASLDSLSDFGALAKSPKPCILIQAGIHSGEIDGKDAGLMLLRDLVFTNKQKLLEKVNLLFIPILNVDGHERMSPFNRPNQRGPQNMGWRTNANNLNLNRDYVKLDTREIASVLSVIDQADPDFYMDIHVTDGVDFQYDVTYAHAGNYTHSPSISSWFSSVYVPSIAKGLIRMGHIPGPYLDPANGVDFSEGIAEYPTNPNF